MDELVELRKFYLELHKKLVFGPFIAGVTLMDKIDTLIEDYRKLQSIVNH